MNAPATAPRSSFAAIDQPLAAEDNATTSIPIQAHSRPPPSVDPALKDEVVALASAVVSFDAWLAPIGVVESNHPAGTLTTVAVHCSDALGVTVTVPEVLAPVAIQYQAEIRCAVPPEALLIATAVSPFGPPGSVPCVTSASDARQQMIRSPVDCAGLLIPQDVVAVLLPELVQLLDVMYGPSPGDGLGEAELDGLTLALGVGEGEADGDVDAEGLTLGDPVSASTSRATTPQAYCELVMPTVYSVLAVVVPVSRKATDTP